ncbi:CpaD family pilus assembly protein [Aestuariivirga sp.]|uniref:CpaD family pilus assembly protein n=1 Tax=Aestuariivirga sp. TaxID=2650926 RepID=UPI0039E29095
MSEVRKTKALFHLGVASVICSAFLLAGCQTDDPDFGTNSRSSAFYDRYPIRVKNAPVKVGVVAHQGMLSSEQTYAVQNFARDAVANANSAVTVKYPSGGVGGREAALQVTQMLADEGVPRTRIYAASYSAGAGSPVLVSYQRKVAVTKECGDWSMNLGNDPANRDYPNFGCAFQQNIAAMVSNPEDFERPRTQTPIIAANRTAAMKVYYGNGEASQGAAAEQSTGTLKNQSTTEDK